MTGIDAGRVAARAASSSLADMGLDGLAQLIRRCCADHEPDSTVQIDPRDGLPVIHAESRAGRGHATGCVVCDDTICPAVDLAPLPGGEVCWLTPNLYPVVYPFPHDADAWGVHLVQWSSSRHDRGLPGATPLEAAAILGQLARVEGFLLHHAPRGWQATGEGHRGRVNIIKNCGSRVGGSVEHDHQQVLLANLEPVEPARTVGLRARLLDQASPSSVVADVDGRAVALVPAFMRRPLHAFVVPTCEDAGWLHHLEEEVLDAMAQALAGLTAAVQGAMSANGGTAAWNLLCHAGPGCGPLFELRPASQPLGGFEQLGLYVCEERPETSAARLRAAWPARAPDEEAAPA